MNCKEEGAISFLAGLLLGGIIGAGIGMLIAPESGEDTRKKLKKTSSDMLKKSQKAINKFQEEKVEPFVEEMSENIKKKVSDLKAK